MALVAAIIGIVLLLFTLMQPSSGEQSGLRVDTITIVTQSGKKHDFSVEVAEKPVEQEVGLMYRTEMAPDHGMIFLMGRPAREISFWMKNTLIPLDMLFVGEDGVIRSIHENAVPKSLHPIASQALVVAVIEINGGLARQLGISAGDRVIYPYFQG